MDLWEALELNRPYDEEDCWNCLAPSPLDWFFCTLDEEHGPTVPHVAHIPDGRVAAAWSTEGFVINMANWEDFSRFNDLED